MYTLAMIVRQNYIEIVRLNFVVVYIDSLYSQTKPFKQKINIIKFLIHILCAQLVASAIKCFLQALKRVTMTQNSTNITEKETINQKITLGIPLICVCVCVSKTNSNFYIEYDYCKNQQDYIFAYREQHPETGPFICPSRIAIFHPVRNLSLMFFPVI